mmetsp:Transcript_128844/g.223447  ORF Transcript_128844/g.223447 Transcript_128844/m.223447 type:complete len:266 (-) Transcript_128844:58-855(-)
MAAAAARAPKDARSSPSRNNTLGDSMRSGIMAPMPQGQKKDRSKLVTYTWRCHSFPELLPELETHTLAKPSRMVREKWLMPEHVVGTKAFFESVGPAGNHGRKSLERHQELNERHSWLLESSGAIHGNPSAQAPPDFGWQPRGKGRWLAASAGERWTPSKDWRTDGDPKAEHHGLLGGKGFGPKTSPGRRRLGSTLGSTTSGNLPQGFNRKRRGSHARAKDDVITPGSMTKSLPDIGVHGPFPASPAYVRDCMRRFLALEQGQTG